MEHLELCNVASPYIQGKVGNVFQPDTLPLSMKLGFFEKEEGETEC